MAAQLGGYLRYASSRPRQLGQLLDLAVGPLFWLWCFHSAALTRISLTSGLSCEPWEIYGWVYTQPDEGLASGRYPHTQRVTRPGPIPNRLIICVSATAAL